MERNPTQGTRRYLCWDDSGCEVALEATDERAAAQAYVDGGDWTVDDVTTWIPVHVLDAHADPDEEEPARYSIQLDPEVPPCTAGEHDWDAPHDIVGGLRENPGVFGHGGGVVIHEVCTHCGVHRHTDTWAQNRSTGEQGLRSIRYEAAK